MKNWSLFTWAVKRLKIENGKYVKCFRNDILLKVLDLSGVTPKDVDCSIKNH